MGRITSVTYRKLKSGPGFTHEAVEVTADVDSHERPDDVLVHLRIFVDRELGDRPTEAVKEAWHELRDAVTKIESVQDKYFAAGVGYDIPF